MPRVTSEEELKFLLREQDVFTDAIWQKMKDSGYTNYERLAFSCGANLNQEMKQEDIDKVVKKILGKDPGDAERSQWNAVLFHCRQGTISSVHTRYTKRGDEAIEPLTDSERRTRRDARRKALEEYLPGILQGGRSPSWKLEDLCHSYVEKNYVDRYIHPQLCGSQDMEFAAKESKELSGTLALDGTKHKAEEAKKELTLISLDSKLEFLAALERRDLAMDLRNLGRFKELSKWTSHLRKAMDRDNALGSVSLEQALEADSLAWR